MNVAAWADENLAIHGDYPALIAGDVTWSSRALFDRSCRLASGLVAIGVAPGDRVALVLASGIDLFVSFEAALRVGAVPVVVSTDSGPREAARIIRDAAPTVVVGTTAALARLVDATTGVPHCLVAGSSERPGAVVGSSMTALIETHPPLAAAVARDDSDPAQVVYTSGTTGAPKGIVYTHGHVAGRYPSPRTMNTRSSRPIVRLMALPPAHALGGSFFFLRLVSKSTIVCLPAFDPVRFLETVERHRVSTTILVPAMCEAILTVPDLERYDRSSLKTVVVGGAAVPATLAERFEANLGVRLSVSYGLTEVPAATIGSLTNVAGGVGRLVPGVEARVLDEYGRQVGFGVQGDVELRTPWVSSEHGASSSAGGWFQTGDVGYLTASRELFIVGRSKDQISQAGVKVFPQEVLEALAPLAGLGLEDAAVIGVVNPFLGEEVVLCVVRAIGSLVSEADILAHLRAHLDPRKMPASVLFLESLPKTDLGKIRTPELRAVAEARRAAVVDTDLTRRLRDLDSRDRRAALEAEITACVRRIVERQPGHSAATIEPGATFGELGVDSVGAVEIANALSAGLGRHVPATVTFDHPTVGALRDHLLEAHFQAPTLPPPGRRPATRSARSTTVGHEPIAIVGIGCRLPGMTATVSDPDAFWELLRGGVDAVRVVSRARLNIEDFYDARRGIAGKSYTREAALLEDVDLFDADFFGVSAAEARDLDPQHRLLLEAAWDAISHAGIAPARLSAGRTGVFAGMTGSTYPSGSFLGLLPCMAAGRLSHFLDLSGPSLAIDTACSSSLVAIHTAVQSLRRGESEAALAGGVHVIASPRSFVHLSAIQALASDGRSKAFDARADGYGRGEGAVLFLLEPLSAAEAQGDRVMAVIRGSAVNHDARSTNLTAPSGRAQRALIEAALRDAGIDGHAVDVLEAHGTGTRLGDPVELASAVAVLGRDRRRPLVVGSVKSNIGHLEAAAGASGVLKAVLALGHAEVPPHLHFQTLNPVVADLAGAVDIPTGPRPWPRAAGARRVAGVTSLGFGGTNAHVVLEEAPDLAERAAPHASVARLVAVSARTATALEHAAAEMADRLDGLNDETFGDAAFTSTTGRAHFAYRRVAVATSSASAAAALRAPGATPHRAAQRPAIAMLFAGRGPAYNGMGQHLRRVHPAFSRALDRCRAILDPILPSPLLDVLDRMGSSSSLLAPRVAQPALFAFEWSLAELWRAWGIEAESLVGHGVGEHVAATIAGEVDLDTSLRRVAGTDAWIEAEPASLASGVDRAIARGCDAFVEIGPGTGLLDLARQHCGHAVHRFMYVPSVRGDRDEAEQMLESLGALYTRGLDPAWAALFESDDRRRIVLPSYPFERKPYWSFTRTTADKATIASRAPDPRPSGALSARARDDSPDRSVDEIVRRSREFLAKALDRPAESFATRANLLDEGLDSLQVMDWLADLGRTFDVACSAEDFFSRPTLEDFATFLAAGTPAPVSPLVTIHPHGWRTPTFCLHPAGGQVTAYLPLHALLGNDHPLYAIQSRACGSPALEHPTIAAMAVDYATLAQSVRPRGPYRLLGWSFGGLVAHAIAAELERRGEEVELVGVIDALPPGDTRGGDGLLFAKHIELLRAHVPGVVKAPIACFWAATAPPALDEWARRTSGALSSTVIGGTHQTIVLPPFIQTIMRRWAEPTR